MYDTNSNPGDDSSYGQLGIPEQLVGESRFIKIKSESKRPEHSPEGPFFEAESQELANWIQGGGNVGLNLGPLVALDVDSDQFKQLAHKHLFETFSVRSGSGGEHWYYRCDWDGRAQFTNDNGDLGSIRSGNWYVVIPPSIHPNGNQYEVIRDKPIRTVADSQLDDFIQAVNETANTAGGGGQLGGGGGGCVGGSPVPSIPPEYPERPATWETAKGWLSANGLLESLNRTASSDWSGLEFKLAKCLAEGGFSESSISTVLDRLPHSSKWHRRDGQYRRRTVRKAIVSACEDSYVSFDESPDDSGMRGVPDEGKPQNTKMSDATYTDHEEVEILEGSEDGDSFKKVVRTTRKEDGETVEYIAIKSGIVQEVETVGGDTVLARQVRDSTSLGSPEYIDDLAEALQELDEKL
jgi:hypothetical protein